jgi:ABC-type bacteriocin/lantibiotic exporter with double-glycine peptidase domain
MTGALQGVVLQLLSGVPRLRVTAAERNAFAIWAARYSELLAITFHQTALNNAVVTFKAVFNYLGYIAIFIMIGYGGGVLFAVFHQPVAWKDLAGGMLQAGMSVGTFVAFNTAYGQFLASVFGVTQVAIQLINLKPLYERVTPVLAATPETQEGDEDPGDIEGEVEVRDVYFRYRPELPLVLTGLTLRAQPGQFVALVGPSGAGKSSLVRLLLGFEQPEQGSLFIDGKDIQNLEKRALRRNFGVVLQNGRVLSGSIFHNITAGANLTREDAWEAARLAGFDRDIEQMPMGMDTFLGEGATTISGGQRQRLMIARAIVRRPRILIFDEATSALDNETQALVSRGLASLKCTRVVIAHRLSTIIDADVIYAMAGGRVVESGTYAELIEKGGMFAELARRQIA